MPLRIFNLLLLACGLLASRQAYAQKATEPPLRERIADEVATDVLIDILIEPMHIQTRSLAFKSFPLETRLALFLSSPYQDLSPSTVELAKVTLTKLVPNLAQDPRYANAVLKLAASERNALNEKYEAMVNNAVITNAAILSPKVVRAEQTFASLIGKELNTAKIALKTALLNAITAQPEVLKPFAEVPPPSEELKQSRSKVRLILAEARKAGGR